MELPAAFTVGDAELERVAALGWRGLEEERLGGWLLRAGGGFTGRANSVLPLGDPGLAPADALDHVMRWYAARGLPAVMQVPIPLQADLRADLLARGWADDYWANVLVGDLGGVLAQAAASTVSDPVTIDGHPDERWLSLYHYRGGELPPRAVEVLTRGDVVGFASAVRDDEVVAIGRGAVADGWLGLSALEVAASARRQGLGTHVLRAVLTWGAARGARSTYLQVHPDNGPALALYAGLGFAHHHSYVYLVAPDRSG